MSKFIPKCVKIQKPCDKHAGGKYYNHICGEKYIKKNRKPLSQDQKNKISVKNKLLGIKPPSRKGKIPWNKGLKGFRSGEKSSLWKGGITDLKTKIRCCFEYRQWRSDVFYRDNFMCQWCNQKGGELNADHIKPFALILIEYNIKSVDSAIKCHELWDLNNGRTLCKNCHKKTDSYLKNIKY